VNSWRTASPTGEPVAIEARQARCQCALARRAQFAANRIVVVQVERS
jgi:hypothetical protein